MKKKGKQPKSAAKAQTPSRKSLTPAPGATIREKDQKILWSRSAGRCSFQTCRAVLTLNATDHAVTLGEMCHIVGEKNTKQSPRGISNLSLAERNSYSNLVLMCAHHHKMIDKDEKQYTVEILHKYKDDHEIWVSESLSSSIKPDPSALVYAEHVDTITSALQLDRWHWFSDNATRDLIHEDFYEARGVLNHLRLSAVYDGTFPKLESCINDLTDSFNEFITHHESMSELRPAGYFAPDRSYSRFMNPQYALQGLRLDIWADINFRDLCNYTIKLNAFADSVREYLNPLFYRIRGRFVLMDSMGVRSSGNSAMYFPTQDILTKIQARIDQKQIELKDLEKRFATTNSDKLLS